MIEKLQKKLTLLLSSVSIFLLVFMLIFPFLFNKNSIYSDMRSTLASAINTPMYQDSGSYAVFQMMFDSDGNIIDTNGADFFLDREIKQDLISDALNKVNGNSSKFYSSINGGKLQYIKKNSSESLIIKPPIVYLIYIFLV